MDKVAYIIVEPVPIVRWALSRIVEEQPNSTVDKEFDSMHRLVDHLQKHSTDVTIVGQSILLGLRAEHLKLIKSKSKLIVALAENEAQTPNPLFFETIHQHDSLQNIQKAIRKATCEMAKHKDNKPNGSALSDREIDILKDIALGLSAKEIAAKNFISPHTVITHRKNITKKLGIKTTSGLTIYAVLNKHIRIEEVE